MDGVRSRDGALMSNTLGVSRRVYPESIDSSFGKLRARDKLRRGAASRLT